MWGSVTILLGAAIRTAVILAVALVTAPDAARRAPAGGPFTAAPQQTTRLPSHFSIQLPRDVYPERATIFYSVASRGRMPERLRTVPDVFDYAIDVGTARTLKLLIVAPGYQVVAVELAGSQLAAATPYTPTLVPSDP
jgi:hypothetical protein